MGAKEQFGVQYLAQGHFDMWTGGAGGRTADLLITGRHALPPELQPLCMNIDGGRKKFNIENEPGHFYQLLVYTHPLSVQIQILIGMQIF